ncbi:right-handed parallel beta-helix repeat-containing protein [Dactylosporangium sp. CA-092794]|uniref:right-handed parallel beta-helix repeat-containing protein n=1 Tax=Dactylosporangium sp. CA-092794 TaxID=3239929 RepID=UPI003D8D3AA4
MTTSMPHAAHPRRTRRVLAGLLLAVLAGTLTLPGAAGADPTSPGTTSDDPADATARREAALVDYEDARLNQVRAVATVAAMQGGLTWSKPYRLDTGGGYTLVLTQRGTPYQIADLLQLAPQTFVRQNDGAYMLTENIYLSNGAKLNLTNPGGLTLRLVSNSNGFVSIVSFGGELSIAGTPQAPTTITSWDPRTNQPDTDVQDGRAYIRAIGGQFTMSYTTVANLGFWSGRTGGLSLTGTERPDAGQVSSPEHLTKDERHQAKDDRLAGQNGDGPAKSSDPPTAGSVTAQPSGPLTSPDSRFTTPGLSYVSVNISHSTMTGNEFGLFISSAQGITITDTVVEKSLSSGLVMHRGASSAVIERTVSRGNGGDGFVMSRATQEVRISGATSQDNGGNGFTVNGEALAEGPSASGESTATYGANSISNSVAQNNKHYGIEVLGGIDIGVQNNRVVGSDMGIVARQGGSRIAITGNQLSGQKRQGIAVRDGVTDSAVTGNVITGAQTAVYVRASVVEVRGNTIQSAKNHGITMVGKVDGSTIAFNVVGGVGPSALDLARSGGDLDVTENQTFAWYDTSSFWVKFRHYASPMTLLWAGIFLLILFAAVKGGARRRIAKFHPYADKRPLVSAPPTEVINPAMENTVELSTVRGRARVPMLGDFAR